MAYLCLFDLLILEAVFLDCYELFHSSLDPLLDELCLGQSGLHHAMELLMLVIHELQGLGGFH